MNSMKTKKRVKTENLVKFLIDESIREGRAAARELQTLEQWKEENWTPPRKVRQFRENEAAEHTRRAEIFSEIARRLKE
jgi:hypothetical protein